MKKGEKARTCQYATKVITTYMLPYSASVHKGKKILLLLAILLKIKL
jgi:hypothetical protein